jgi:hypothetical protein
VVLYQAELHPEMLHVKPRCPFLKGRQVGYLSACTATPGSREDSPTVTASARVYGMTRPRSNRMPVGVGPVRDRPERDLFVSVARHLRLSSACPALFRLSPATSGEAPLRAGYFRQNVGVNNTATLSISKRPKSMAAVQTHVCASVSP